MIRGRSPFADKNLEAAVKDVLKHSKGPLDDKVLGNVFILHANGKGIKGVIETHGMIAVAEAEMCPCCGRPMPPASTDAALRAADASGLAGISAGQPL